MNPNEAGRLAHAINDLRPDWPISSVRTFIERELINRAYRDAAVALTWVAVDRRPDGTHASETPKRVLEAGPWWRAAAVGEQGVTVARNPSPGEACPNCSGFIGSCRCTPAEVKAARGEAVDGSKRAEQIRAGLGFRPKRREATS